MSESCLVTASTRWMQLEARLSLARSAGKEAGAISSGIGIAGGAGGGIGCATAIACIRDGCCSSALEYDEDAPASLLLPGDLLSLSYIRSSIEAGRPLDPLPELDEPSPEGVPSSSFRSAPMASSIARYTPLATSKGGRSGTLSSCKYSGAFANMEPAALKSDCRGGWLHA